MLCLQKYKFASDNLVATCTALLAACYQQAKVKRVQLTEKNCPTLVLDTNSK